MKQVLQRCLLLFVAASLLGPAHAVAPTTVNDSFKVVEDSPVKFGPNTYYVDMSAAKENQSPAVNSPATGVGHFVYDPATRKFDYRMDIYDIDKVTAAHIHRGDSATNGPVIVGLYAGTPVFGPGNPRGGTTGTALTVSDAALLPTQGLYVNVHSQDYPGGEIRDQLRTSALTANDSPGSNGSNLTVNAVAATSEAGGTVTLSSGVVTYTPPPNFNGLDNFTYTITDGTETSAPASVFLTVLPDVDVTPPMLHLPEDITTVATGPSGAAVTFTVQAMDDEDGEEIPYTCTPASGSTFPIGTTSVACSTTDQAGHTTNGSFNVTVEARNNNASFVSQTAPPSPRIVGQTTVVSVRMMNTGNTTWTSGGGYYLSSQNPLSNTFWGTNLRPIPAGVSVAPGQSVTFSFVATAPATAGTYNFQWRMVQSGVGWFGAFSPSVNVNVINENAQFVSQVAPNSLVTGQTTNVSVTMKNTGATTWTRAAGYVLSSQNPQSNTTWGVNLVNLPVGASIAPGQSHTFTFPITAPSTAGTYNFQWRVAHAGVGWFGDFSTNKSIQVISQDAQFVSQTGPPATMTNGQTAVVSVTMKNTGTTTWTSAGGFGLSAQNPQANNNWGTNFRPLPVASVAPGASVTFTFVAKASAVDGTYNFQWRMAQSGVGWFGQPSTNIPVTVQ